MPELLEKPVDAIADADLFAYRNRRAREGSTVYQVVAGKRVKIRVPTKPSRINRDLRTLRAALKKARPEYRFPGGPSSRRMRRASAGSAPTRSCSCSSPCRRPSGRWRSWPRRR